MAGLSDTDLNAVRSLGARASDTVLDTLIVSLSGSSPVVVAIRRSFERERGERRAKAGVFSPLKPFSGSGPGIAAARLTDGSEAALWSLACSFHPELCECLIDQGSHGETAAESSAADDLCRRLARDLAPDAVRGGRDSTALDGLGGEVDDLRLLLTLAPLIRAALPKLAIWTHQLTAKSAAELRTAFGAAARLGEDAGPLFIEAIAGHLDEPCHVLRLISLILDQPTDEFLAGSALGPLAERLLVGIERGVSRVHGFTPGLASVDGAAVGAAVMTAAATLLEFEQWVDVGRSSGWGVRLAALRRALAVEVEAHLKMTPKIMAEALPTRSARWTQRSAPRTPKLARDPDAGAVACAREQAAFLGAIRRSPSTSGFAALLAKTCAELDDQLDSYVEGLLDLLHRASAEDRPRLRAYLDVAARLTESFGGEPAGRIVRRRAAAA